MDFGHKTPTELAFTLVDCVTEVVKVVQVEEYKFNEPRLKH